jgi:hypothetical protein
VTPYIVGESYRIASLEVDYNKLKLSEEEYLQQTTLTYMLVDAPDGWFIASTTGEITGSFEDAGSYSFAVEVRCSSPSMHPLHILSAPSHVYWRLNYKHTLVPQQHASRMSALLTE